MCDRMGWIVQATAGRDKDGIFCVVGVEEEQKRLLLADGKRRKAARPKRKQPGHVCPLADGREVLGPSAMERLEQGESLSDRELRRALAAFRTQLRRV